MSWFVQAARWWVVCLVLANGWPCLALAAPAPDTDNLGLLFRVQQSGAPPSYIFGTIHSEDPRVTRLAQPVRQAFDGADKFAMEVVLDGPAIMAAMAALVLSDGRDLQMILGDDLYRRTVEALGETGLPEPAVRKLKPWAAVTLLSTPPSTTGSFLDVVLYRMALEQGKQVFGLEQVHEQLQVFDSMPEADQIRLLDETLALRHMLPVIHEQLLAAYLDRDLAELEALSLRYMEGSNREINHRFNAIAIDQRNRLMVERMLPLLSSGNLFIAVGALHLPGPDGILNLLGEQGFLVQRVY